MSLWSASRDWDTSSRSAAARAATGGRQGTAHSLSSSVYLFSAAARRSYPGSASRLWAAAEPELTSGPNVRSRAAAPEGAPPPRPALWLRLGACSRCPARRRPPLGHARTLEPQPRRHTAPGTRNLSPRAARRLSPAASRQSARAAPSTSSPRLPPIRAHRTAHLRALPPANLRAPPRPPPRPASRATHPTHLRLQPIRERPASGRAPGFPDYAGPVGAVGLTRLLGRRRVSKVSPRRVGPGTGIPDGGAALRARVSVREADGLWPSLHRGLPPPPSRAAPAAGCPLPHWH